MNVKNHGKCPTTVAPEAAREPLNRTRKPFLAIFCFSCVMPCLPSTYRDNEVRTVMTYVKCIEWNVVEAC